MKHLSYSKAATVVCGTLILHANGQNAAIALDPIYVRSTSLTESWPSSEYLIDSDLLRSVDAAALVRNLPGAAIVRNGSQTGILQLRGLSGDRVGVRVDGMTITPACPNHMDPPLHYAHPSSGDLMEMYAGISPVSVGGDQIGGSLSVKTAPPVFAKEDSWLTQGTLGASYLGSQNAALFHADLTLATDSASLRYRGSAATADNLRYPGGTVSGSGYENTSHQVTGAWQTSGGFIALDIGFSATRDAGTPALPMDMIEDDAWRFGLIQNETYEWGTIENRFYMHDIEHLMDNYTLRQPPMAPMGMAMKAPSSSRDFGWRGDVTVPRGENKLRMGIDLHRNEFDAEQIARDSGLSRDTFQGNRRSRFGAYVDWEQEHSERWTSRIGLRGDVVMSDAGAVQNEILPPPGPMRNAILADQDRFNAADRSFTDVLPAATASLRFEPDEFTGIELAVALKSRAPSLVERYLWTPLNANAGLADGRTYLGNLNLDSETSLQAALAFTRKGENWNAGITPFYQSVYDYIQGMPINRMVEGRPVLQYDNIDRAELYGFEMTGGWQITDEIALDGSLSYVRGRNQETGDDLYRIAPLRGMFDLSFQRDGWESRLEWVWADAQNHVSESQNEESTPGYGILNLRVAKTLSDTVRIEVGVENLLDKRYADHLGGVNRVIGGDLDSGERIPSAARFGYASIKWEF